MRSLQLLLLCLGISIVCCGCATNNRAKLENISETENVSEAEKCFSKGEYIEAYNLAKNSGEQEKINKKIAKVIYQNLDLDYEDSQELGIEKKVNIKISPYDRLFLLEGMRVVAKVNVKFHVKVLGIGDISSIDQDVECDEKLLEIQLDKYWKGEFSNRLFDVWRIYNKWGIKSKKIIENTESNAALALLLKVMYFNLYEVEIVDVEVY